MLPDRVSNPGPLTYESGALPIAPRGPAAKLKCVHATHILYEQCYVFRASQVLARSTFCRARFW